MQNRTSIAQNGLQWQMEESSNEQWKTVIVNTEIRHKNKQTNKAYYMKCGGDVEERMQSIWRTNKQRWGETEIQERRREKHSTHRKELISKTRNDIKELKSNK